MVLCGRLWILWIVALDMQVLLLITVNVDEMNHFEWSLRYLCDLQSPFRVLCWLRPQVIETSPPKKERNIARHLPPRTSSSVVSTKAPALNLNISIGSRKMLRGPEFLGLGRFGEHRKFSHAKSWGTNRTRRWSSAPMLVNSSRA